MDLHPAEFEQLIGRLFENKGLKTTVTQYSRDGGVDVVAQNIDPLLGGKIVIQAKRYRHTVGVSAVRELYGTMMNEGASKGILVTTSQFGQDAHSFADQKPITLLDGNGLLNELKQHGIEACIIMPFDS
jgi:restriction system protein